MAITQKQIAAKLGISQPAVAFALSDSPEAMRQLGQKTRGLIVETARQMGYVPHYGARRMARSRTSTREKSFDQVGLIYLNPLGSSLDLGCMTIMSGAEQELSRLQASLNFVRVGDEGAWGKVERLALSGGVDGWLVVGQADDAIADRLKTLGQPFVIVGDSCCTRPVPHVDVDNFGVGYQAARHLASLGHRRIAYLTSSLRFAYQRLTIDGFRAAVKELGLEEDERLFGRVSSWERRDGAAILEWLLRLEPVPTAVFAPETPWLTELGHLLQSPRIKVPGGISLLGVDLTPRIRVKTGITRIEIPIHEIGEQGAVLLHRLVCGAAVEDIEAKLSSALIDEGTTAPPPAGRISGTQTC